MTYDKVVDSTQLETDLATVADAIRAKGKTTDKLAFPAGFADAVAAISTGGGADLASVEVYVADFYESSETSVTTGALDIYARVVAS